MHTEKRAEFRRGRIEKWEPPEGQREVGRRAAKMNPNSKHRVMLIALLDKTHRTVLGMTGPEYIVEEVRVQNTIRKQWYAKTGPSS